MCRCFESHETNVSLGNLLMATSLCSVTERNRALMRRGRGFRETLILSVTCRDSWIPADIRYIGHRDNGTCWFNLQKSMVGRHLLLQYVLLQGRMTPFYSLESTISCTGSYDANGILYWHTNVGGTFGFVGMGTVWMLVRPQSRESFAKESLYLCRTSLSPWWSTSLWRASASFKICRICALNPA